MEQITPSFFCKSSHIINVGDDMKRLIACILMIFAFSENAYALDVSAVAACLMNPDTGEVLFEKNAYEKMPMASTTKIMTAILALEKTNPDDIVTVSKNAQGAEGSSIYIKAGDKIRMEDLLYGLMLESGNDAAIAVAEYVSGNTEQFAEEMTALAKKIGAKNTQFKNPNGLDAEGHYTTAYDLAKISAYAMKNPDFQRIVSEKTKNVTVNTSETLYFRNHNKLLKMYDGANGIKTGYTKKCGRCLVSAAERGGRELIAVTLNAPDDWNDHIALLDFGFENCSEKLILRKGSKVKSLYTKDKCELGAIAAEDASVFCKNMPVSEVAVHIKKDLKAPIAKDEKIGTAEILIDGKKYAQVDLVADRTIEKQNSIFDEFGRCMEKYIKMYLR